MSEYKKSFFWFRRDLRLTDNHGLYQALKSSQEVIPLFIFDEGILSKLDDIYDRRIDFIHRSLQQIDREIKAAGGSGLLVIHGNVKEVWESLINDFNPDAVFCNHDYEPQAIKRDMDVEKYVHNAGAQFRSYKDQVIFEEEEILKADGMPYTVFTPYSKSWRENFSSEKAVPFPSEELLERFSRVKIPEIPKLTEIGFEQTDLKVPPIELSSNINHYDKVRDIPSLDATSRMSVHLRFGTVSIRKLVNRAIKLNDVFLSELIWREFFMMIIYHFPESVHKEFREKYRGIQWRNSDEDFQRWCQGKTGYPIVDAGMRELNSTGFMHNRVRMITASFLVKHLLIDWRKGERYFAKKLLDFDLSANIGNWQWAAGTGCDAAPYFRIFNPYSQTEKFDKNLEYIKRWAPEFGSEDYPEPMVDHKEARERALRVYKEGIKN